MNVQFDHILLSSFYLWFENELLNANAYITGLENQFKKISAKDIPQNYYAYQGGYRQLVAESSIDSPNSGFYVNGNFIPSSGNGFWLDYNNGRIIVPKASGASLNITGLCSVKEINTYISNEEEEHLVMHGDFREEGQTNPYWFGKEDKLDEKTYFLPACFISLGASDNDPFAFGGEETTKHRIKVLVLTQDNYLLDATLSKFRDCARKSFKLINYEDYPYGAFDSIKNEPYSYSEFISGIDNGCSPIDDVNSYKITSADLKAKLNKSFSVGFIDFDISTNRFPRF